MEFIFVQIHEKHNDAKIKSSPIISKVGILKQDIKKHENKNLVIISRLVASRK